LYYHVELHTYKSINAYLKSLEMAKNWVRHLGLFNVGLDWTTWCRILSNAPGLVSLTLEGVSLLSEDGGLNVALPRFRRLTVHACPMLGKLPLLELIQGCPNLAHLSISGCDFTEAVIRLIRQCASLLLLAMGSLKSYWSRGTLLRSLELERLQGMNSHARLYRVAQRLTA
jgi:hypothetical protein